MRQLHKGGSFGKLLVSIWIGLIVMGFVAQTTEGFGSEDGVIVGLLLGALGFLMLLAFGASRIIHWLLDEGGLAETNSNESSGNVVAPEVEWE